jgi:chromosome segregation ATPase
MKSNYLSQISSLKATLSGKTAEVNSLKEAVGDAERRVGEALENLRDERGARESMQADKDDWEKRGKEMENVLRSVKQEIMREEREKDSLSSRLEECERKREEAETRIAEAESRTAGLLAASESNASMNHGDSADNSRNSSKDVEAAVEKVARELHALYKSKHETKVSALKKSYEARWEKKVKELEAKLEDTSREIEELRIGRDSTMSGVVPRLPSAMDVEQQQERAELVQQAEEQKAKLLGLASEVASIKKDNFQLRNDLEKERNEKGDLVGAVEELLMIQAAAQAGDPVASNGLENLRGSISRASGLRGPGFTSRMPGPNLTATPSNGRSEHHLTQTNSTGSTGRSHSRGNSGIGGARSGIMSNIERMGRGRGD